MVDKERGDVLKRLDEKNKAKAMAKTALDLKRSCFVRMVSDPKIYNPKIINIHDSEEHIDTDEEAGVDSPVQKYSRCCQFDDRQRYVIRILLNFLRKRPWISWPLAFILRSGAGMRRSEDVAVMAEKEVSMRYWK